MREFVPIDFYDEDAEYVHVNPNIIVNTKLSKTVGETLSKEFPWTVATLLINLEEIDYYFKTKEEAKVFVRKISGIS